MKAKPGLIQKQLLQVVWLAKKYWFFLSHEAEMNCGDKSVNPSICSLYLSEDLAEKVNYGSEGFKFMFFFSICNIFWSFKLNEKKYTFDQLVHY